MDVTSLRLVNQHLIGDKFSKPSDVVSHFGAVQAQDFPAAKWGLAQRMEKTTDIEIEKDFNEGKFIRTHIMRPTWHFVMPENLLWMQKLTSPNVKRLMNHYNRKLELTDNVFNKTTKLLVTSLKNKQYKTRQEIKKILEDIGIKTNVQRLAHILMWPELEGIICSGPRIGKQFSYALVDERIKNHTTLSKEKSLGTLATMYFISHGPAQLKDFSWWSGLSIKDSTEAIDSIKSKLSSEIKNGKTYYFFDTSFVTVTKTTVFLLSIFDEYTIAYNDRTDLNQNEKDVEKMIMMGNALNSVVVMNGKVTGTWRRILKSKQIDISLSPFRKYTKEENELLQKQIENYGAFLEIPVHIV